MKRTISYQSLALNDNAGAGLSMFSPGFVFIFFGLGILFLCTWFISFQLAHSSDCLGAPYLYVTLHGSSNIQKYSRDGCSIAQRTLWYGGSFTARELRGMMMGQYQNKNALYVCDSAESTHGLQSQVFVQGSCGNVFGYNMRSYLATVVAAWMPPQNPGAVHAFAVTQDRNQNVYVSFQNTDVVLRFHKDIFVPMQPPETISSHSTTLPTNVLVNAFNVSQLELPVFPGTFAQFGKPGIFEKHSKGLRSIVWVKKGSVNDTVDMQPANRFVGEQHHTDTVPTGIMQSIDDRNLISTDEFSGIDTLGGSIMSSSGSIPTRNVRGPESSSSLAGNVAADQDRQSAGAAIQYEQGLQDKILAIEHHSDGDLTGDFYSTVVDTSDTTITAAIASIVENQNSIIHKSDELWITNEELNLVLVLDEQAREVGAIIIKNPVHLYFDAQRGLVFVGSKSSKVKGGGGAVYAIDIHTRQVVKTFSLLGKAKMNHPTGIAVYDDILFVGEQQENVLLTFNVTTQRFLRQIVSKFSSDIEHVIISDC